MGVGVNGALGEEMIHPTEEKGNILERKSRWQQRKDTRLLHTTR